MPEDVQTFVQDEEISAAAEVAQLWVEWFEWVPFGDEPSRLWFVHGKGWTAGCSLE